MILICVLLGVGGASADIAATTPTYNATAQVFVTLNRITDPTQLFNGDQFAQSRVQSYVNLVNAPSITRPVRQRLGLTNVLSDRQLAAEIHATAPLDKVLINITVSDTSATRSARLANAVASQLTTLVASIESKLVTSTRNISPLKLTVTRRAVTPSGPATPVKKLILIVGFFGGLLVGLLLVLARERFFRRVRTASDVAAIADISPLCVVPHDGRARTEPNAFRAGRAIRADAFRQLRTNLLLGNVDHPPRVIAISSPTAEAGTTSVALNLAIALAETDVSVVLIDADLRNPGLAALLDVAAEPGLTSVLQDTTSIDEVIHAVGSNLAVVPAGPVPINPSELLASRRARTVLREIADRFDYAVIDTPALLSLADGAEIAALAQATVLVVRASRTRPSDLQSAVWAVTRVGGTVAGVALNRVRSGQRPGPGEQLPARVSDNAFDRSDRQPPSRAVGSTSASTRELDVGADQRGAARRHRRERGARGYQPSAGELPRQGGIAVDDTEPGSPEDRRSLDHAEAGEPTSDAGTGLAAPDGAAAAPEAAVESADHASANREAAGSPADAADGSPTGPSAARNPNQAGDPAARSQRNTRGNARSRNRGARDSRSR